MLGLLYIAVAMAAIAVSVFFVAGRLSRPLRLAPPLGFLAFAAALGSTALWLAWLPSFGWFIAPVAVMLWSVPVVSWPWQVAGVSRLMSAVSWAGFVLATGALTFFIVRLIMNGR